MQEILENLHSEYGRGKELYKSEKIRLNHNEGELKKSLNRTERKLLLRIRDDYDLIIEKTEIDSFINGVTVGAKLMLELLYRT